VVVVLVVPLPTFVVDLLITANITGSILILLTAMQVKRPSNLSTTPLQSWQLVGMPWMNKTG